ncbi:MAG: hypothetical protein ACXWR1_04990 [Bdellovibrionota bacterium]
MQLTSRDKTLIRLLCRHNLLSTKQIQERVFAQLELTTVMRRLRKLQAGGFIVRLGMLPCRTWVWGNSQLSNELFTGFASSSRTNLHTLHHDTQLSEVRLLLEEITRVDDWLDIRHIARDAMPPPFSADYRSGTYNFAKGDATLVPDAMFIGWKRSQPFTCALELELSIKAAARYRRIFSSYSYRKTPEAVLYVVENDQIRHAIDANAQYDMRREERTIYTVRRKDLFTSRDNAVLQRVRDRALVRFFELFDCKARMGVHQDVQPVDKPVSTPPRRSAEDALWD